MKQLTSEEVEVVSGGAGLPLEYIPPPAPDPRDPFGWYQVPTPWIDDGTMSP